MAGMQADAESYRHRRIVGWGIAGLFLLLGVAIVVSVLVRVVIGPPVGFGAFFFFPFGFFLFLFFLFFLFGGLFRPWAWGGWGWRGYPMYRGWGYHEDAAEILRRRYALGEITKDQFDQMMRDLRESRSPPS